MRSLIASLRSLVLPFGATSGPRIILNGVDGRIEIYSNAGDLLMTLDDDGLRVFDSDGEIRQALGLISDFSSIEFWDSAGENPAFLTYSPIPGSDNYRAMQWIAPRTDDVDNWLSRLLILTPYNSLTKNPLLQWDTGLLDPSGAQPIADLVGFSTAALRAVVAVDDIRRATSNGAGNAPTLGRSYPRGCVGIGIDTNDVNLSSTAGTFTDLITTFNVPVQAGRRYRVMYSGPHSFFSGGSGFSVGDNWEFHLQVDEGSGFVEIDPVAARKRVRANVAIAGRWPVPTLVGYHEPASDGTFDYKCRAAKMGGAATVDTTVQTSSGDYPHVLTVDDIGDDD